MSITIKIKRVMKRLKALESKGYKVVRLMDGGYIATKGSQSYKADSISALYNQILKPKW